MYVGHTRIKSQTHTAFQNLHELIQFNSGLSQDISTVQCTMKYWRLTWLDAALQDLSSRNLILERDYWLFAKISKNKTIMDFAVIYSNDVNILRQINACRMLKKLLYPFELLGFTGTIRSVAFYEDTVPSQFVWEFNFLTVTKLSTKTWKVWKIFIQWLESQQVCFHNDIDLQNITTWWENKTNNTLIRLNGDQYEIHKRREKAKESIHVFQSRIGMIHTYVTWR